MPPPSPALLPAPDPSDPAAWSAALARTVAAWRAGGLVGFPTETVYGVGAAADDPDALARLRAWKGAGRGAEQPFQWLVAAPSDAARWAEWSPEADRLARRAWPGPLTLVLPRREGTGTVGLRCPDLPFIRAAVEALGRPVAATSANPSGEAPAEDGASLAARWGEGLSLVVEGGRVASGVASTVARLEDGRVTVLRAGALSAETLARWAAEDLRAWNDAVNDVPTR